MHSSSHVLLVLRRQDTSNESPRLYTVKGKRYPVKENDLPFWGTMEIHTSVKDAEASIAGDDRGIQLVRVADHQMLQSMVAGGQEILQDGANLYCRVAPSCPPRYALFETAKDGVHHEITSDLKKLMKTQKDVWRDHAGDPAPVVKLFVFNAIKSADEGGVVLCMPGCRGVDGSGGGTSDGELAEEPLVEGAEDEAVQVQAHAPPC